MRNVFLAVGLVVFSAGHAIAAQPWSGVATVCRATPPLADEASALPGGAKGLVATILSESNGAAVAMAYPGSSNKDYNTWYPYVCLIAGPSIQGAPHTGSWVEILPSARSSYSDYTLSGAAVFPYSDPAGLGQEGGGTSSPGGSTQAGFPSNFQYCDFNNVPRATLNTIQARSCFTQAFNRGGASCLTYPTDNGHPTLLIMDGFYNSQGQYCPDVYGSVDVTLCQDGGVHSGVYPSC